MIIFSISSQLNARAINTSMILHFQIFSNLVGSAKTEIWLSSHSQTSKMAGGGDGDDLLVLFAVCF